jgi:hypothetical protein
MKSFKYLYFTSTLLLLISCVKNNDTQNRSERFNLMQGRWKWKAAKCINIDTNTYVYIKQPDSYVQFNMDNSGEEYAAGYINSTPLYYNYELLEGDSVFTRKRVIGTEIKVDSLKIDKLTSTEFVYHGVKLITQYTTPTILCIRRDSLYR